MVDTQCSLPEILSAQHVCFFDDAGGSDRVGYQVEMTADPSPSRQTLFIIETTSGRVCLRIRDAKEEEGLGSTCRSPKALPKFAVHIGAWQADSGPLVRDPFSDAGQT
jgi:hypothetical protein